MCLLQVEPNEDGEIVVPVEKEVVSISVTPLEPTTQLQVTVEVCVEGENILNALQFLEHRS